MKNIIVPKNLKWHQILKMISENMDKDVVYIKQNDVNVLAKSTQNFVQLNENVISYIWRATKRLPVSTIQIKKEKNNREFKVVALNYNGKLKTAQSLSKK